MSQYTESYQDYQKSQYSKNKILNILRKKGFRITKQRLLILDIILKYDCTNCKEVYYQAALQDPNIGMATIYRMINILVDMGILKTASLRPDAVNGTKGCRITLKDDRTITFDPPEWNHILDYALRIKGASSEEIKEITLI